MLSHRSDFAGVNQGVTDAVPSQLLEGSVGREPLRDAVECQLYAVAT